jgi:rod shape-determining protein MreC
LNFISRWWRKYGRQVIWGGVSILLALLIYHNQGSLINEILYRLSQSWSSASPIDRQALSRDRTIDELTNKIIELQAQNEELKKLLNYTKNSAQKFVTARVIGRSADAWWQLVTINVGSNQGIKKDDMVLGIGGLVGRVTVVTPNTSRVLLISDYTSRVGAKVSRTSYQGFIKGQSSQVGILEFYDKVTDVKIGDVVTTSSLSTIFPPSIPIGRIIGLDLNKTPAPQAEVEFTAPINFLEWLIVSIENK